MEELRTSEIYPHMSAPRIATSLPGAIAWVVAVALAAAFLYPARDLLKLTGPRHYFPPDFMQFYLAGKLVVSGRMAQLYQKAAYEPLIAELEAQGEKAGAHPYNRPAFRALLAIPVTWIPYRAALALATTASLVLLGFLVWRLPIWFGSPGSVRPWLGSFAPFLMGIAIGQDNLLMAWMLAGSIYLATSEKQVAGGVLLGLCVGKPHLIWAAPFALAAAGKRQMLKAFIATGAVLTAVSAAAVGPRGVRDWLVLLQEPPYDPASMCNLRALTIHFGASAALLAGAVILACFGLVLHGGSPADKFAAAILTSLLFSPHTYHYDLSVLPVLALFACPSTIRWAILLPWPYFYARSDLLPWIGLLLVWMGALAWPAAKRLAEILRQKWPATTSFRSSRIGIKK